MFNMENFQLYRTNLLLGGQLKWDIVIENTNNNLFVKDFHLSPISNNIQYCNTVENVLLNNKHQENVRQFYKQIEGQFYEEGLDSDFSDNWPALINTNNPNLINRYSNIYDMGCKRMKNYSLYNKQFEFFCPLWLEKVQNSIKFTFYVNELGSKNNISTRSLILDFNKQNSQIYHNNFCKYLNDYFIDSKIKYGNDNLLSINFNNDSFANGLNVKTGEFSICNISEITSNIISRERPVIETDNLLSSAFYNNTLICNQLYNFNICFNLDDIMSSTTANMFIGEQLNISVDVYVDNVKLDKKTFYYEYDFIPRHKYYDERNFLSNKELQELNNWVLSDKTREQTFGVFNKYNDESKLNVLDHLQDNNCLSLITKNKFCPKICHWSLSELNDYIFNIYKGYEGYGVIVQEDLNNKKTLVISENNLQYANTPDVTQKTYNINSNNIGWINHINIKYYSELLKYIQNPDKYKRLGTYITGQKKFFNGLKYKNNITDNFYIANITVPEKIFYTLCDNYLTETYQNNDIICFCLSSNTNIEDKSDFVLIISYNLDNLTFAGFKELLLNICTKTYAYGNTNYNISIEDTLGNNLDKLSKYLTSMLNLMISMQEPKLLTLNTINWEYTSGPSNEIKEIEYFKNNSDIECMFRYDGNLKPTFVDNIGTIYYKDFIDKQKIKSSVFNLYINSGFEPIYPSIGYSACKKIIDANFEKLPIYQNEYDLGFLLNTIEYSWFNSGLILNLKPELSFIYKTIDNNTDNKNINNVIRDKIKAYYNTTNDSVLDYIISKYNIKYSWEYESNKDINNYIYTITLNMK